MTQLDSVRLLALATFSSRLFKAGSQRNRSFSVNAIVATGFAEFLDVTNAGNPHHVR